MADQGAPNLGKATEQMTKAFHEIQQDVAKDVMMARQGKMSKTEKVDMADTQVGNGFIDEKPHSHNLKADHWKECGEPIAYWGEGNDRTQCPCKPDPSKTPIKDSLDKRLELISKSPQHKW